MQNSTRKDTWVVGALAGFICLALAAMDSHAGGRSRWPTAGGGLANGGTVTGDITMSGADVDLNGNKLVVDEDGDSYLDYWSTDDIVRIVTGGTTRFAVDNGAVEIRAGVLDVRGAAGVRNDASGNDGALYLGDSNGIRYPITSGTTVSAPTTCDSGAAGISIIADDTDDSATAVECICLATSDDGAGTPNTYDWVRRDDNGTACPLF